MSFYPKFRKCVLYSDWSQFGTLSLLVTYLAPKHSRLPFYNVLNSEYVLCKITFVTCNTAENKSIFYYYRLLELHHIQNEWTSTSWILPTPTPWTAWAAPSCTPWSSLPSSEYFPDLFACFAENEASAIT